MITLAEYWMGRDTKYPDAVTPDIQSNTAPQWRLDTHERILESLP